MTKKLWIFAVILALPLLSFAQSPISKQPSLNSKESANTELPMSYRAWKEQQVLDAQNALLRAQNSLRQSTDSEKAKIEKEIRKATDQVDMAKEFTIDEYLAIYLSKYQDKPELVLQMIEKIPKEEAKEILTGTFRKAFQPHNAKQKQSNLMIGSSRP